MTARGRTAPASLPPIIARMSGGLGNQLFQYACARTIADRLGTELLLDLSGYGRQPASETPRSFGLDAFRIRYRKAATDDLRPFTPLFGNRWQRWVARSFGKVGILRQRGNGYDPRVEQVGPGTCLIGHWQSERFFINNAQRLRQDLVPMEKPGPEVEAIAQRMAACTSVSVHVRRGDYVTNPVSSAYHALCGPEYYRCATGHMLREFPHARFFVFSDDMDWAQEHLRSVVPAEFVHRHGQPAYMDMFLMARCKHHIIANSSFSWWGAWLNPDPSKTVIAPEEWYRDPTMGTHDLLPPNWIAL